MKEEIHKDKELEPFALRRIKICRDCEDYELYLCKHCGCFMPAKTKFKLAKCPINKWTEEPN
jgi:hypothetical protein